MRLCENELMIETYITYAISAVYLKHSINSFDVFDRCSYRSDRPVFNAIDLDLISANKG